MFSIVEQNEDGRIIYVVDYGVEFGIGIVRVILGRWYDHTWWAFCVISDQNSSVVNVAITLRIRSRIFTLTRVRGITSKVNTFAICSSFNSNERTEWELVETSLLIAVIYFNQCRKSSIKPLFLLSSPLYWAPLSIDPPSRGLRIK